MSLKKRWWLSFLLVVALLFAADFFVLHVLFPWKQAALLQEIRKHIDLKNDDSYEAGAGRVIFQQALRDCVGPEANDVSPDALFERLHEIVEKKIFNADGSQTWFFKDDVTAKIFRGDNQIQKFEWKLKDKTLSCEGFACQCL